MHYTGEGESAVYNVEKCGSNHFQFSDAKCQVNMQTFATKLLKGTKNMYKIRKDSLRYEL